MNGSRVLAFVGVGVFLGAVLGLVGLAALSAMGGAW